MRGVGLPRAGECVSLPVCVGVFKHAWGGAVCSCMRLSLCVCEPVSVCGAMYGVMVCENEPVFVHVHLHTY